MTDTPDPAAIARRLSKAQRAALAALPAAPGYITPSDLGQAMGGTRTNKAQALGRLGGTMAWRLRRMDLAYSGERRGGFPGYTITPLGQAVRSELARMEATNAD